MKTFAYDAVDPQGRAVSGTVEASDWTAARELLIARGLNECREAPTQPSPQRLPALGAADAVELATYLSELAKAGLPLGGALRAVAKDLPPGRLTQTLGALAKQLEAGHSLEAALESLGARLPPHVRDLVIGAARSGQLAHSLERVLAHERHMDDMTRQFWQALAYPALLLAFFICWLLFATLWLIPEMHLNQLVKDFGVGTRFEAATEGLDEFARVTPRFLLAALCATLTITGGVWLVGGRGALSRMFAQLPLVGPAWWYRGLIEFCGLLHVFLEQQLPLGDALRLASSAASDGAVKSACRKAADEVANGRELSQCLEGNLLFPPTLIHLVRWGQRHSALSEVLAAAREMYRERFELQMQLVRQIVPPVVFLLVAVSVLFIVGGVYGPVQKLITDLATWPRGGPPPVPIGDSVQLSGVASVMVVGASLLVAAHVLKTMVVETDASRRLLRYTGLVLLAIGLLGVCLAATGNWALITWPIVMGVWARGALHYRAAQRRHLFSLLALAVKRQMPLAPVALAFADEQEGPIAGRAHKLAKKLTAGASLSEAIAESRGALPPEAALAVDVGTRSGDLHGALAATTFNNGFDRTLLRPVLLRLVYVFPVMLLFVAYMKLKIEPAMARIFTDFGIKLPAVTREVMGLGGTADRVLTLFVLLMIAMVAIAMLAWLQWRGTLKPRLPILKRTINWVDMALALRVLALAARLDRPFPSMLIAIARFHPKRSVRAAMHEVAQDADNGRAWQESLRRHRLLSAADAAILTGAQRSGNLAWALGEMAESFERRATYRLQALAQVVLPIMVLPVGLCAAFLAVAYFAPLTALVENLSL